MFGLSQLAAKAWPVIGRPRRARMNGIQSRFADFTHRNEGGAMVTAPISEGPPSYMLFVNGSGDLKLLRRGLKLPAGCPQGKVINRGRFRHLISSPNSKPFEKQSKVTHAARR